MDTSQPPTFTIATIGIPVTDQDRALESYTATITLLRAHDGVPGGVETGIRLASPDAAAAHQRLRDRGVDVGELLRWEGVPPMFAFRDPDYNGLEIIGQA